MGAELQEQYRRITPREIVDELNESCAFYLSIGMPVEEFWWGDNSLPKIYKRAYTVTLRRQNQLMHRQGAYIYEALCDASPLFRDLVKGQVKPHPYSSEPVPIDNEEVEEKRLAEEKARYERIRDKMFQHMFAQRREAK